VVFRPSSPRLKRAEGLGNSACVVVIVIAAYIERFPAPQRALLPADHGRPAPLRAS
jgi:hypothetical protein